MNLSEQNVEKLMDFPERSVEKLKNTVIVSINKCLENNTHGLSTKELELCKTFISSAIKLHDDIVTLILTLNFSNGNVDISHIDIPMVVLSISNIVTDNYNTCDALKKCVYLTVNNKEEEQPNLLVLVQFILMTLIEYNIIFVPSDLKPTITTLIKYSIQLLETTLPTIEKMVEHDKKMCYRFFVNIFSKFTSCNIFFRS
jgi:hypothetical protein